MKNKILLLGLLLSITHSVFSQETKKKIYFLADTINVSKANKMLDIVWGGPFHYSFVFHCKCVRPYHNYVEFASKVDKKNPRAEIELKKPKFNYISFKELMDIASKYHKYFNENYDLYITEILPKNKFQTNRVTLMPQSDSANSEALIEKKQ